jgi:hypothetical protein
MRSVDRVSTFGYDTDSLFSLKKTQGLRREDLVVKFGGLRHPQPDLQPLAAVVAENENVSIRPLVLCTPDSLLDGFAEGNQCACKAAWGRGAHRLETHSKAWLGRAWLIRVSFMESLLLTSRLTTVTFAAVTLCRITSPHHPPLTNCQNLNLAEDERSLLYACYSSQTPFMSCMTKTSRQTTLFLQGSTLQQDAVSCETARLSK